MSATLTVQAGAETLTPYAQTDQSSLAPGEYADFYTTVTVQDHRPAFHVASVKWANNDGTAGIDP